MQVLFEAQSDSAPQASYVSPSPASYSSPAPASYSFPDSAQLPLDPIMEKKENAPSLAVAPDTQESIVTKKIADQVVIRNALKFGLQLLL